jgi:hypothetical protein
MPYRLALPHRASCMMRRPGSGRHAAIRNALWQFVILRTNLAFRRKRRVSDTVSLCRLSAQRPATLPPAITAAPGSLCASRQLAISPPLSGDFRPVTVDHPIQNARRATLEGCRGLRNNAYEPRKGLTRYELWNKRSICYVLKTGAGTRAVSPLSS